MKFLIVFILILLPTTASADIDISEYMKIRNNLPNRFSETGAPVSVTYDPTGGRTELDVLQREAESKRNNEAGLVGEKLVLEMFWDTGVIPYIGSFVAELGLGDDPDFNIHAYMDELMEGITANYIPTFTRRADSYEEGIMLREVLLDKFVAEERAEAAVEKGVMATVVSRMPSIALIVLLLGLVLSAMLRRIVNVLNKDEGGNSIMAVENKKDKKNDIKKISHLDGFIKDIERLMSTKLSWGSRTNLEQAYTAIFIFIFIGLLPLPYEFYSWLRVVVCIGLYFFFKAIYPRRAEKRRWLILIIGFLILYNPFEPIHLGSKIAWSIINVITLYYLYKARLVFDGGNKSKKE